MCVSAWAQAGFWLFLVQTPKPQSAGCTTQLLSHQFAAFFIRLSKVYGPVPYTQAREDGDAGGV